MVTCGESRAPIVSQVPTIWLPRSGAQIVVAAGAAVSSGLSGHRNFAVWLMLDSVDVAVGAGKENVVLASLGFVRAGAATIIANVSLGSPPFVRVLPSEDWSDILITAAGATRIWLEDLSAQTTKDT